MKYEFSICRTVSTFSIVAIMVFIVYTGGSFFAFIHLPSLICTFGICFFMMLSVYEIEFLKFIPQAFRLLLCRPAESNPRLAQIALFGSRSTIAAGIIAMIVGLIQMLQDLSDPSSIGLGISVAMMAPLYAIIISEIFFAIVYQSFKDANTKLEKNSVLPVINAGLPLLIILFMICVFVINLLGFCRFEEQQIQGLPFY